MPRKRSLRVSVTVALVSLFIAFLGFRIVQFTLYLKDHPTSRTPGAAELTEAAKLIIGSSGGMAHGNTAEAKALAERVAKEMKIIRETMFTKGKANWKDDLSLTKGEFVVFCQLNEDSCAFLIHVPKMRNFTTSAKDSLVEFAYVTAASVLDTAQTPHAQKLAVATRGYLLFDRVLIGDYQPQNKDPLSAAHKAAGEQVLAPSLYPFFQSKDHPTPPAK